MVTRYLLLGFVVLSSACASRSDRVVARAAEGLAYDAVYHPTQGGDPVTLQFLQSRAAWLGVDVAFQPSGHESLAGATGRFWINETGKHVVVASDLPVNGRLEVLAHELGHAFQPPLATRMEGDVFAELVAVEVCRRFGVDASAAVSRYLRAMKSSLGVAKTHRLEIDFVADMLTRGFK